MIGLLLKKFYFLLFLPFFALSGVPAAASGQGFLSEWLGNIADTAANPDTYDAYLPFWTWHNRLAYTKRSIERYNESPRGAGFGLSKAKDGEEHALYLVIFEDSNFYTQASWGYAWIRRVNGEHPGFHYGYGFTISAQMRHEYDYVPIPIPLPMFSAGYENLLVEATYIPGYHGFGNVLFMWLRIRL
jgi:palmitoyl transferase